MRRILDAVAASRQRGHTLQLVKVHALRADRGAECLVQADEEADDDDGEQELAGEGAGRAAALQAVAPQEEAEVAAGSHGEGNGSRVG